LNSGQSANVDADGLTHCLDGFESTKTGKREEVGGGKCRSAHRVMWQPWTQILEPNQSASFFAKPSYVSTTKP